MNTPSFRHAALALAVLLAAPAALAQTHTLRTSVVSAGGTTATGGSGYTLRGTVGQIGGFSSGSSRALGAGFWYQATHLEAGRLLLVETVRAAADSAAADADAIATSEATASSLAGVALPTEVALDPPRPNPSSGPARLRFALPHPGRVRLSVYDALGRRVALLADGERAGGWYEAALDGQGLASGLYVARLEVGGEVRTQRLTVLR